MSDEPKPPPRPHKDARPCPALNGWISRLDCGLKRGSQIQCPAHCAFFPFGAAAYDSWLRLDEAWTRKSMLYLEEHLGPAALREVFEKARSDLDPAPGEVEVLFILALQHGLFLAKDRAGLTPADRWEAEGWRGLNNDERVMMRYRRQTLATVIEVQRVRDGLATECVDLLDPDRGSFLVFDRSLTRKACRFTRLLAWLTHYPYYTRLNGAAVVINAEVWEPWRSTLEVQWAEQAGDPPAASRSRFLSENFGQFAKLLTELAEEYLDQTVRRMDFHDCVATYRLGGSFDEIKAIFDAKPDFGAEEPGPDDAAPAPQAAYAWLRLGESAALEDAMPGILRSDPEEGVVGTVGTVRLYADRVEVRTMSKQKHRFARAMLTKYFGPLLVFDRESITDLAKLAVDDARQRRARGEDDEEPPLPAQSAAPEEDDIPPETRRELIREAMQRHYQKFLDTPIPALDGLTPRQAASVPQMRSALVELMKGHVHHVDRLGHNHEAVVDISWVLEELGLAELK